MESLQHGVRRHAAASASLRRFGVLLASALSLFALVVCSVGCASETESASTEGASEGDIVAQEVALESVAQDAGGMDFSYSDRDLDASYDSRTATSIELAGSSAEVQGSGASVDGSTVHVSAAGTYVVSGELSGGAIVVEAGEQDKVQIVLSNASIQSQDGTALSVVSADKCFVTLEQGTSNVLADSADYVLEEGADEPNAALYSKADLTLNGSGALVVEGNWQHAVCSKDDLVIAGGSYDVSAVEDAFRGKDCVKVADGSFAVNAGGDGFVSTNDEDETRGFVSIDAGTFDITAQDEGLQAYSHMRLAGGEFAIDSEGDAVHSDGSMGIEGGTYEVSALDDAFHAETTIEVADGTMNVASCYEGLEAQCVYLRGGNVHIAADDDAVNAASPSADGSISDATASSFEPAAEGSAPVAAGGAPASESSAAPGADASQAEPAVEADMRGGTPETGMAEGGAGMGDSSCVIEITGGYHVLSSGGDTLDSNGSISMTGGTVFAQAASGTDDFAIDYDIEATIDGGTFIALGGTGMTQNLTSGSQAFGMANVSGEAGQLLAVVDEDGSVLGSFAAQYGFETVIASAQGMADGETYGAVVTEAIEGANEDGYAQSGALQADEAVKLSVSTTAQAGFGGLSADGAAAQPGMPGDVRQGAGGRP